MTAANCGWTFYLFTAKRKKEKTCWKCCIALDEILYCSGSLHSLTTLQLCAHVHTDRLYGSDNSGPGQARNTHGNGWNVKLRTDRLRMWRLTYFIHFVVHTKSVYLGTYAAYAELYAHIHSFHFKYIYDESYIHARKSDIFIIPALKLSSNAS